VDYLQGLQIAARSMNALDGYSSKTIVMIGTGLSTQGIMNFKNNLLSVEPEAVIDMLEEKEEIPDLSGITVVWQQLGDVAAPQQELSQRQYKRLEELWGGIVERGGGEFVYNEIMPLPANEDASFPEVDVVDLPAEAPIAFSEDMFESEDENTLDQPVMLTEKQVRFVPDSASYLDEKSALKTIRPIADYLVKYDQKSILLAGTTAGDEDNEESRVLSQKRAETVKASLVAMGINESRIQTIGLGSSDPWHVPGAGFDGPIASGNRKVVIMDISSDDARKILGN
jgi:outer membrane protein OmpA-like peptidoglycan-associated protein